MAAEHTALTTFAPGLFAGRSALITGGGRGIGRAAALAFAHLGANVAIASRKQEHLEPTAADVGALGVRCLALPTDIRDTAQVDALVQRAIEQFGGIDFLVNNAGGQFPARPHEISDRGWRAVVDLNLNGTWNMCSRVGPHMTARGFGAIVNVVHIYALDRGAPPFAHSGAARAGVVNLTKTLAYYWGRRGVTVNALAPGAVTTAGVHEEELSRAEPQDYVATVQRAIPAHRFGDVDEIAAIILFLCSPAARYINGTTVVADGALSLSDLPPMLDPEQC